MGLAFPIFPSVPRAQTVPVRLAPTSGMEFPAGFTAIGGVLELRGGSVLVLDVGERTLHRLTFGPSAIEPIGRHGSGPQEYQRPIALLPQARGRVALSDPGNARMLVLDSNGNPTGTVPDPSARMEGHRGLQLSRPTASDSFGSYYAQGQSAARGERGGWQPADSAAIERWSEGSDRRDTLAYVGTPLPPGSIVIGGYVSSGPNPTPATPFSRRPTWTVSLDGWIAIVHLDPYRIDLYPPSRQVRRGAPIPSEAVNLTERHKAAWREEQSRPRMQTVYPGGGQAPYTRTVAPRVQEPAAWPRALPPVTEEPPRFDPIGRIWVGRSTPAGAPRRYDLVDRNAARIAQVELPPGTRLAGFGLQTIYLVRTDADDLEHLQRYPISALKVR